jgi:transglutaminase-like putative cysteine protease
VRNTPAKVLWRAGALAYYDGAMWQESRRGRTDPEHPDIRSIPGPVAALYLTDYGRRRYPGLDAEGMRARAELWEAHISLQAGDTTYVVSVLSPPVLIESPVTLRADQMDTFRFVGPPIVPVSYTVLAEFAPPSERELERAQYVSDLQAAALLRDEIQIGQYRTPYEKIKAIQSYLEQNYTYTLDIDQPPEGVDPLEYFLLTAKHGHCEFFASAMALMLRESGIISRVVYGYMTTEESFNRYLGGSFVVRRRDAHAWVEAGLDLDGDEQIDWVAFDPSPRRAESAHPRSLLGQFFAGVGKFFEALKMRWHESIVAFDRRYQNRIAERIETTLHDMQRAAAERVRNVTLWVRWLWGRLTRTRVTAVLTPVALVCFLSAGALLIARRVRRRVEFRRAYVENQPERQVQTVRFYERMLRLLLQHDVVKPAQQTPREFAGTFEARRELAPSVGGLTDLYYAVRFGHAQLTGKQIRWVHEALATIRKALGRSVDNGGRTAGSAGAKPLDTPAGPQ